MLAIVLLVALFAAFGETAPASGPVKISDNNIENIYNINININGIFTNSVQQDIVNVVAGLLNQQEGNVALKNILKEQLKTLVAGSSTNDVNIDVPVTAVTGVPQFDFSELVKKLPATADILKQIPDYSQENNEDTVKLPETQETSVPETKQEPTTLNESPESNIQDILQKMIAEAQKWFYTSSNFLDQFLKLFS